MNKKILVIAVALLAVAMLATPVFAIGPENAADKNPNFDSAIMPSGVVEVFIVTQSGLLVNEWALSDPPYRVQLKDAGKFYIGNAVEIVIADPSEGWKVFTIQKKWTYLSQNSFLNLCLFFGAPNAAELAALHPQGVYNRGFQVGK